jgi:hypothetical protein
MAPDLAHTLRHEGRVEPQGLGTAADGPKRRALVGEAGEVTVLQRLELGGPDAGAVPDGIEGEIELLAGSVQLFTVGERRRVPLAPDGATTGRPVAPCDDHDDPLPAPRPIVLSPGQGRCSANGVVGIGGVVLEAPAPAGHRRRS